jgi:hypothetical protein
MPPFSTVRLLQAGCVASYRLYFFITKAKSRGAHDTGVIISATGGVLLTFAESSQLISNILWVLPAKRGVTRGVVATAHRRMASCASGNITLSNTAAIDLFSQRQ